MFMCPAAVGYMNGSNRKPFAPHWRARARTYYQREPEPILTRSALRLFSLRDHVVGPYVFSIARRHNLVQPEPPPHEAGLIRHPAQPYGTHRREAVGRLTLWIGLS